VRGNVYMIVAGSSNIAVSVGADGALLVDSGSTATSDRVLATVKQLLTGVAAAAGPARPCVGCAGLVSPLLHEITATPAAPKPIRYIINTNALPEHTGGNVKIAEAGKTITGGDIVSEILGSGATDVATVVALVNVLIRLSEPETGVSANGQPSEV
jgi:glyoxylase-like metal-dependent hydrolase (beta-lactamase superfamily II)